MSDDVKDFAYYADAAERILSGITEDMPVLDVAAVAACAQVFATLDTVQLRVARHVLRAERVAVNPACPLGKSFVFGHPRRSRSTQNVYP
jgi:hypothetical protein